MKILFLILIAISYRMAGTAQNDTMIIKGKIHAGNFKTVKIGPLYDNPITGNLGADKECRATVQQNGEFIMKLLISKISRGYIYYGNYRHEICLLPSDNLFIEIYGDSIKYKGKGSGKNNFLFSLEKFGNNYYSISSDGKMPPNEYANRALEVRNKRVVLINEFAKKQDTESSFVNYFLMDNRADFISKIHNYTSVYSGKNKIPRDSLAMSPQNLKYFQFKNIQDDELITSYTYVHDLSNFVIIKAMEWPRQKRTPVNSALVNMLDSLNGNILRTKEKMNQGVARMRPPNLVNQILVDSLNGLTQEYVIAKRLIVSLTLANSLDTFLYDKFKLIAKDVMAISTVENELLKFRLRQNKLNETISKEFMLTQVEDTLGNVMPLSKVVEKFRGKVIYLDIWGLSCAPCRALMPISQSIKAELKNKPIDFVYLTTDKTYKDLWKDVVRVSMSRENHYRLHGEFNPKFSEVFNMKFLPCYMIIDKYGNLVEYNAARPNDPKIVDKLLKVINK